MPLKFFTIAIHDDGQVEFELNQFLGANRVLVVDRKWVDAGLNSFWAVCVDYLPKSAIGPKRSSLNPMKARVDYKEILSPDEFILFAKLRDLRKEIAQTEAVPVYAVFTNEQLSQMIQQQAKSKSELSKIEGVGESRIEKYGSRILELLVGLDETGQEKP